jgi:hypothetical protein
VTGNSTRANQVAKDSAGGSPLVGSGAGATRVAIGLQDLPALPFAGLWHALAFLCLVPVAIGSGELVPLRHLSAGTRLRLILLGLPIYSLIQVKHL